MAIDLSQFYQVFFEETDEHLANMESLLLGLDMANPDIEQLNAIFRAAHSIKGSAGTFGFTDMAQVTHILENLLDRIRKGELALRDEMIDAFLDAGDVLKTMLAGHKGDGEVDPAAVDATCARLKSLTGGSDPAVPTAEPVAAEPQPSPGTGAVPVPTPVMGCEIQFVLEGAPEVTRAMCDSVLGELADFGGVRLLAAPDTEGQPYRVELLGEADGEALRGMLEFVARSDSIRILPLGGGLAADATEDAYGLFSDEATPPAVEEAYGLFADVAPSASSGDQGRDQGGEAYGLFDEMPASEPSPAVPADAGDGSYGFFADVPAPATAVMTADAASASVALEGDGFGLFVEVPVPVAADVPVAPAVAKPAADAPAEKREVAAKPAGKAAGGEATIRVGVDKVDQLINLVGELVITQAMLAQSASGSRPSRIRTPAQRPDATGAQLRAICRNR